MPGNFDVGREPDYMILIAYIVLGFSAIQFAISLINIVFREKPRQGKLHGEPLVSVLIPARNEESNIGKLLGDLQKQNYNNVEIIVFDDQSEDKTADVVKSFSAADSRIRLLKSSSLPEGWLGKNHACHSLSLAARGDYFLFPDADVRISGGIIGSILSFASEKKLALVSVFPKQVMLSAGEKATVPVMNYILLSLLPLILVRKSFFPSLAAANGQFMFFDATVYKAVRPHERLKTNRVEDIETARMLKRLGYRIACLAGNDEIKCRMYQGFKEAVNGFSKNVTCFFGNSFLLAFLFWIITTAGFIYVLVFLQWQIFMLYMFLFLLTRVFVSVASEQNISVNLAYMVPQQISLGIIVFRALINRIKGEYLWKGRSVR